MSNKTISAATDSCRKTIMEEIKNKLLGERDNSIQFPKSPIRIPSSGEIIVQIRYQDGRILVGLDTDMEVEEEDLELYSIDEMLAIAEKVF